MNLDSLSFDLSQINYSVANVTKKNLKSSIQELASIISKHGSEAERHLLRCLFSHVEFSGDGKNSGKDSYQTQYLIQECFELISKPDFISTCCYAIDNPLHQQKSLKPSASLLPQISRILKLTKVQEVAFGLALHHSSVPEICHFAQEFVAKKLPILLKAYVDSEGTSDPDAGFHDTPAEVIHYLLAHLLKLSKENPIILPVEQKEAFLESLKKDFPQGQVPIIVEPLLYSDKLDITIQKATNLNINMPKESDSSIAELIKEIGYGLTSSFEDCRSSLMHLGHNELTPSTVAKILSLMARTHSGLSDSVFVQKLNSSGMTIWNDSKDKNELGQATTWNVEIFVHVLRELIPNLKWKDVVYELDHPNFLLKDRQGLKLLWSALMLGLGDETFPMEHMYRQWRNIEGQISFFQQVLKNSDIVCLVDYQCHPVSVDVLKAPPEEDSRDIANWKSLNLFETLLFLSEAGYYSLVQELFKFPVQHCPDLAVLGLLQVTAPMNMLRQELLTTLIPVFLGNHPNSAIILQFAWHCQAHSTTVKPIIMHSMAEWYMRGDCDQTRLSRILDVAQDLKALSALLNGTHLPFVIDLACLASRREYLKLDKWLTDKIREHGEQFLQACVNFLKRRCPQILGSIVKEESLPKSAQLPPETLATMLSCLQVCASNVSRELSETILTMVGNCSILLNKPRQPPPGVVKTPRGLEPAFSASSISVSTPSVIESLGGLPTSMSNLSLTSSINNSVSNFITSGLSSLTSSSAVGSPAKLYNIPSSSANSMPAVTSAIGHNPFSLLPNHLGQFSSQLGLGGTSSVLSPSVNSAVGKSLFGPQSVERLRQGIPPSTVYPSTGDVGDMSMIFPDMTLPISKDVEDEANSYFQRIYNHPPHPTLSIDEVLDMLKKYQESNVRRERDVFNCMVRNLFEEYRFFPQYPDKELLITAQLFGGIIDQGLVSYMSLGLALRCVLDALRKPHGTKMYYFGITALDRFKGKLKEYPQYCTHLASIAHFQEFPQHLIEYVEYGSRSSEPPTRPQGNLGANMANIANLNPQVSSVTRTSTTTTVTVTTTVAKPATVTGKPSIANATNIDTLLVATSKDEKMVIPPEAIQDKMAFIINNLAQINITQKVEEFKELMKDEYWMWTAQYLVLKRASIEHNFHTLYSNFLDNLKMPELSKLVVEETFRNIKVLLRSDKGIANFSDRSLLKNLGHWLGMLTLAKNKPILQMNIDLKALLIEAYHNGQQELLYVVPFVAKVLESCAKSKVFRPPNPWTIGIMNILAEMHQDTTLKLNLKFEIEVLCKTLSIDINELKPGNVLKDIEKLNRMELQLSPLQPKHPEPSPVISLAPGHHIQQSQIQQGPVAPPQQSIEQTMVSNEDVIGSVAPVHLGGSGTPTSSSGSAATPIPTLMQKPQFSYNDIISSNTLGNHIQINGQIPLFQAQPQLKKYVRQAIEHAVMEWMIPVVDRSIKISITTCEQIVKKDFALDPEESRMVAAAHHMVRNLTAGMTMITCRDPLMISINSNLKTAFTNALRTQSTPQPKELATLVEQAATIVAADNVELACCVVQKAAIEKAVTEMDKRLSNDIDLRKQARSEGRRYCDPHVLTYQAERMPEQIRLKVGGVTALQMAVYEEFFRNIPGFMPSDKDQTAGAQQQQQQQQQQPQPQQHPLFTAKPQQQVQAPFYLPVDEVSTNLDKVIPEIEHVLRKNISLASTHAASAPVAGLHTLLEAVMVTRSVRDNNTVGALIQKTIECLFEGLSHLNRELESLFNYKECHLIIFRALADTRVYGHNWVAKQVTRCVIESRDEYKFNLEGIDCLIRDQFINMPSFDMFLAKAIESGHSYLAIPFATQFIKHYFISERGLIVETDIYNTLEALARVAPQTRPLPEGLSQILELLRNSNDPSNFIDRHDRDGAVSMMQSGIAQAREFDDPPGLHEKTEFLLREWVTMYHNSAGGRDSTKAFTLFVHQMNLQGILKTDDLITRFFRLSTEMCVELCNRVLSEQGGAHVNSPAVHNKCFHTLDAYVRLISLLVKHSGDANNTLTKVNLLNKVLGIVTGVLIQDHESRGVDFQQLPYHRIFIMLFLELSSSEQILEAISFQILSAFCNTLHILNPSKAPGFAYAWLEIVSHRVFLGRLLAQTPHQKGWNPYATLLVDLFSFLAPFLRNVELPKSVTLLYKGTLRVLLVLLHDFPEFLCDYHYNFCDAIPPNCIQMRNLILSAFPRNMRLPDPFTPNLKVDLLLEIMQAPRIMMNFSGVIKPATFKKDLDSYIQTRSPVTFLSDLRSNLQMQLPNESVLRYNIPLINALVLYVGTQAITFIQSKNSTPSMSTITHSSHMDIFQNLAVDLDTEGRYLFLNAIANQLRYPNSHTHYFSCTLLYLFAEANTEAIQEQITRVLLERLIVNRPHPWGLLVTFIELIKNPGFKFWNHEFVRCAPEIEKLFESVARSCMQQKPATEQGSV